MEDGLRLTFLLRPRSFLKSLLFLGVSKVEGI